MKKFDYCLAIDSASKKIYDLVVKTDLTFIPNISQRLGNKIFLKREEQQSVHSFKIRGAYNKILSLSNKEKERGIITASAGNHAQGVALASFHLGFKAKIIMPVTTPQIKINSVREKNGEIILWGDNFDQSLEYALNLVKENSYSFIHPYDDPLVIAGQGTIAKELCEQVKNKNLDYVFVSVGGGGLISGVASYMKKFMPHCKIIGVEAEDSACLERALKQNKRVILSDVGLFADGIAVKQVGKYTFEICKKFVDDIITVSTDEICASIDEIFSDARIIVETAAATAFAGMKKYIREKSIKEKNIVVINSGANINFDRLRYIAEQNEIGEQKEIILAVKIPEKPGSFVSLCRLLKNYSISEFNYRYHDNEEAWVFVGLKRKDKILNKEALLGLFKKENFLAYDLSNDEVSKVHIRYMVGGSANLKNEKLFQITFPEKPKALLYFLEILTKECNISLFHYRNHGAAFGKVLMGVDLLKKKKSFYKALKKTHYSYQECSANLAYKVFLK